MQVKTYFDKLHKPTHFEEDEMVYLKLATNPRAQGRLDHPGERQQTPHAKQLYVGPLKVLKRVSRLAYKPQPPGHWRRHQVRGHG